MDSFQNRVHFTGFLLGPDTFHTLTLSHRIHFDFKSRRDGTRDSPSPQPRPSVSAAQGCFLPGPGEGGVGSGTPWAAQQALTGPHDPVWAAPAQRGPEDGDAPRRDLGLVQSPGQVGLPRCLAEQPAPSMPFPSTCCAPRGGRTWRAVCAEAPAGGPSPHPCARPWRVLLLPS